MCESTRSIFTTSSLSAFTVDIDVTIEELYLGGTLVSAVAGWACPYMTPATLETHTITQPRPATPWFSQGSEHSQTLQPPIIHPG